MKTGIPTYAVVVTLATIPPSETYAPSWLGLLPPPATLVPPLHAELTGAHASTVPGAAVPCRGPAAAT